MHDKPEPELVCVLGAPLGAYHSACSLMKVTKWLKTDPLFSMCPGATKLDKEKSAAAVAVACWASLPALEQVNEEDDGVFRFFGHDSLVELLQHLSTPATLDVVLHAVHLGLRGRHDAAARQSHACGI